MERARSDFIRAAGVDQAAELGSSGSAYAVVEVDIRYRKPARLGDDLRILSTVDQVRASSVPDYQRVMRGEEQLTDARVTAAFLDGEGRPRRQPKDWVEKFNAISREGAMILSSKYHWLLMAAAAPARRQTPSNPFPRRVVAVPPLSTPDDKPTSAPEATLGIAWDASKLIAQDLRTTSEVMPLPPVKRISIPTPRSRRRAFPSGARLGPRCWSPASFRRAPTSALRSAATCTTWTRAVRSPQGLRRRSRRLAARGAQLLRPGVHRGDRGAGHLRHAYRLCRGKWHRPGQGRAHRNHGQRRHQPSLSHRRRYDGSDAAALSQGCAHRLRQLRWWPAAGPHARRRVW